MATTAGEKTPETPEPDDSSARGKTIDQLWPCEKQMIRAAEEGLEVKIGHGPFKPSAMDGWGKARTIRATVLRRMLVDPEWPVHAKGVRLRGVRITGCLDLEGALARCPLRLHECFLDDPGLVILDYASVSLVTLTSCCLGGLTGNGLIVTKDFDLSGSTFSGPLRLPGATISGSLNCDGARLTVPDQDGNALIARGVKVVASVFLGQGFTSAGGVDLTGADITGALTCSGAHLTAADGDGNALVATRVKAANMWLDKWSAQHGDRPFTAKGAVQLDGADISGAVTCSGARLAAGKENGNALSAIGLKTAGDLLLDQGFKADGAVQLTDAVIGGGLRCSGAQLTAADGDGNALSATRVKAANMWLDKWSANGEDRPFTASGAVQLDGADISRTLTCRGAQLTTAKENGNALSAELVKVGGDMCLDDGFKAVGSVRLVSAHVDGALRLKQAELAAPAGAVALDVTGAQITRELVWAPSTQVHGTVSLEDAQVGQLEDDWTSAGEGRTESGYWPRADQGLLQLDGFTYSRVGQNTASLEQRLSWIGSVPEPPGGMTRTLWSVVRHPLTTWRSRKDRRARQRARKDFSFTPQPYEHLATVYQQAGQDSEARTVAIARRRDLRRYGHITRRRVFGNWLLDKTIQYGYQTWRAVGGIAFLYIVIFLLFWYAQHRGGLMAPVQSTAGLPATPDAAHCTSYYPCYSPAGYAIDTVIPLVNVHQASYWGPNASAPSGWLWVYASWAGIVLGWAFATLAVAGYTGLVRSADSL